MIKLYLDMKFKVACKDCVQLFLLYYNLLDYSCSTGCSPKDGWSTGVQNLIQILAKPKWVKSRPEQKEKFQPTHKGLAEILWEDLIKRTPPSAKCRRHSGGKASGME